MRQTERMSAILEQLASSGAVEVTDLAGRFGASVATVRRDLQLLEEQRMLERTHGGAVARGVMYELPLRYKASRHQDEKRRIADLAASRVADGAIIGLTGGTTTTEVARRVVDRRGITVVTNALNIAGELAIRTELKLVVTGGTVRPESYELVGPVAEEALERLNLDVAFVGVDGIDVDAGLTTHHEVEAHTNGTMIGRARRVVVVTDSSKLGRVAFAQICPLDRVDEVITDGGAGSEPVQRLRDAGVALTVV
ncbi:MAG TPA: DeoR/GlpR family DNA-binding transcription regulator [Actinomycetota bacterium]|nr:DeoR/GlpR family DNA-binding transcription regulator [Actinomycetota bacterium]